MDPLALHCPNADGVARGHTGRGNLKIHSHKRRRYRCTECGKTFSERQGTPFYYSHTPQEATTCVLTLIAYGCPVAAIEAAFDFDRRTVRAWTHKAGRHCQRLHEHLVLRPQVLQRFVRLALGTWPAFIGPRQGVGYRVVSTSYIERLNATFRERLAVLSRRTRHLARTSELLEAGLYLMGSTYNFCHLHQSLGRTPAQAAGLALEVWTVRRLLGYRVPPERWRTVPHRGPLLRKERALLEQWGT